MGKLQDFLMEQPAEAGQTTEVAISGFPFPFVIKAITEGENKALRKSCQRVTLDKRTKQRQTELDTDLYNNRLVAVCCVDPNFKSAELQEKYKVRGAEALLDEMLLPGQFLDLLLAVQEVNGFADNVNDLVDEAKN